MEVKVSSRSSVLWSEKIVCCPPGNTNICELTHVQKHYFSPSLAQVVPASFSIVYIPVKPPGFRHTLLLCMSFSMGEHKNQGPNHVAIRPHTVLNCVVNFIGIYTFISFFYCLSPHFFLLYIKFRDFFLIEFT